MNNHFEQALTSHLSEIKAPPSLAARILRSASQGSKAASTRQVTSPFRRFATTLVSVGLISLVVIGALGQAGPRTRYSVASLTVVSAKIHLPTLARLTVADASQRAIRWLGSERPQVTGFHLSSAYHADALTKVLDPAGYTAYQSSFPENDFVLWFDAPAQSGYKNVSALVIVNGLTGTIAAAQIREAN